MTKCAIIQPTYLPWCGYFATLLSVDVFVFLDNVQFVRRSWHSRNKIKLSNGNEIYLSVPTVNKHKRGARINEVMINNDIKWQKKHTQTILLNYAKADFISQLKPYVKLISNKTYTYLSDLNITIISKIANDIGASTRIIRASDMNIHSNDRIDRLIEITKKVGARTYVSPLGAISYLSTKEAEEKFLNENLSLKFQYYDHPVYPQLHGNFISHLSVIDLIANVGIERANSIIISGHMEISREMANQIARSE